jgi:hypothetical protein
MASEPSKSFMPAFLLGTVGGWILSAMMRSQTSKMVQSIPVTGPLPPTVRNVLGHMRSDILSFIQPEIPEESDRQKLSDLIKDAIEILRRAYQKLNRLVDDNHSFTQEKSRILDAIEDMARLDEMVLLDDPALKEALGSIEQQTGIMEDAAKRMTNTTEAVARLNDIVGAAKKIAEVSNKGASATS